MKWPATMPGQTLCNDNKRRTIAEKHALWMAQRSQAIAEEEPTIGKLGANERRAAALQAQKEAEALASVQAYDAEKRRRAKIAKLPPAKRREAMESARLPADFYDVSAFGVRESTVRDDVVNPRGAE